MRPRTAIGEVHFCITPQGEKIPIFWFPPGEVCGGAAFLSRSVEYLASTESVNHSTVLVWDRKTSRSLAAQYPQLLENALLIAYDYFVAYRALHISATCQNARQRLAQVLGNLAGGMGQRVLPAGFLRWLQPLMYLGG